MTVTIGGVDGSPPVKFRLWEGDDHRRESLVRSLADAYFGEGGIPGGRGPASLTILLNGEPLPYGDRRWLLLGGFKPFLGKPMISLWGENLNFTILTRNPLVSLAVESRIFHADLLANTKLVCELLRSCLDWDGTLKSFDDVLHIVRQLLPRMLDDFEVVNTLADVAPRILSSAYFDGMRRDLVFALIEARSDVLDFLPDRLAKDRELMAEEVKRRPLNLLKIKDFWEDYDVVSAALVAEMCNEEKDGLLASFYDKKRAEPVLLRERYFSEHHGAKKERGIVASVYEECTWQLMPMVERFFAEHHRDDAIMKRLRGLIESHAGNLLKVAPVAFRSDPVLVKRALKRISKHDVDEVMMSVPRSVRELIYNRSPMTKKNVERFRVILKERREKKRVAKLDTYYAAKPWARGRNTFLKRKKAVVMREELRRRKPVAMMGLVRQGLGGLAAAEVMDFLFGRRGRS